jgi:hypothetical protein
MKHSVESIFVVEYLREYESVFETALSRESVDPGVLIEKNQKPKKIFWDSLFKQNC